MNESVIMHYCIIQVIFRPPMERIEGYGDFPAVFEVIKKKLEELRHDE
jgi:hypothetical protein